MRCHRAMCDYDSNKCCQPKSEGIILGTSNMDGKDTMELELTRGDSQKYECEKTNDEVGAQLPVDALEKK